MTANSTPESFDAVVAKLDALAAAIGRAGINGFGNQVADLRDRLAAAHAAEVGKYKVAWEEFSERTEWVQQTAKPKELGLHRADVLRLRIEQAEARADAAMGLLQKAQPFVATCPDLCQPDGDELRETIDAFLAQQALAGGERKDG